MQESRSSATVQPQEWVEIAISVGDPGGTSAELLRFCLDLGVYDLAVDV